MGGLTILLILFLLFPSISAKYACPVSGCRNSSSRIQFPFQVGPSGRGERCGYPGFTLSCNAAQGVPALSLPNSGDFYVRSIDYLSQEILLYDPNNCLPSRLLNLNLTGSPFRAAYYDNYTFLSCPPETTVSKLTVVGCMSNSTATTLATSTANLAKAMTACETIASLPVPVLRRQYNGFSSDLGDDLLLTWDDPDCEYCEAQGDRCGFRDDTSLKIYCFTDPGEEKENGLRYFIIICASIVVPTLACAAGIGLFFVYGFMRNRDNRRSSDQVGSLQPDTRAGVVTGLDESTIESYTKVVIGESRRVPGPNDGACAICLSEYQSNETVRCIPECMHSFHTDCIDQWLRMNRTCPVCRNSSPSATRVSPLPV